MDRLASGFVSPDESPAGNSSLSAARTGSILQHAALGDEARSRESAAIVEAEVVPPELWSQLSLPERQRFGHRFSFMVLKALGLRQCPSQETEL